jgi:hypothetical protein
MQSIDKINKEVVLGKMLKEEKIIKIGEGINKKYLRKNLSLE